MHWNRAGIMSTMLTKLYIVYLFVVASCTCVFIPHDSQADLLVQLSGILDAISKPHPKTFTKLRLASLQRVRVMAVKRKGGKTNEYSKSGKIYK